MAAKPSADAWFRTELATHAFLQKSLKSERAALGPDNPAAPNVRRAKVRGHLGTMIDRGKTAPRYLHLARGMMEGFAYRRLERTSKLAPGHFQASRIYLALQEATDGAYFAGKKYSEVAPTIKAWLSAPLSTADLRVFLLADCRTLAKKAGVSPTGDVSVTKEVVNGQWLFVARVVGSAVSASGGSDVLALGVLKQTLWLMIQGDNLEKRKAHRGLIPSSPPRIRCTRPGAR